MANVILDFTNQYTVKLFPNLKIVKICHCITQYFYYFFLIKLTDYCWSRKGQTALPFFYFFSPLIHFKSTGMCLWFQSHVQPVTLPRRAASTQYHNCYIGIRKHHRNIISHSYFSLMQLNSQFLFCNHKKDDTRLMTAHKRRNALTLNSLQTVKTFQYTGHCKGQRKFQFIIIV